MAACPHCGKQIIDEKVGCPDCAAIPAQVGPERDLKLVSVYLAEDEMTARVIHGALVANGIPALIHSEQAPMFGSILRPDHGCWGEVMAPETYMDRAIDVVRAFTSGNSISDAELEAQALAAEPEEEDIDQDDTPARSVAPSAAVSTTGGVPTVENPPPPDPLQEVQDASPARTNEP